MRRTTNSRWFLYVAVNLILLSLFPKSTNAGINRLHFEDSLLEEDKTSNAQRRSIRQQEKHNTSYACEGEILNISCPKGYWIHIIRANYGRFSLNICNAREMQWADTQCKNPKTSRIMEERCSKRSSCVVRATKEIFNFSDDPCPEMEKYLEVQHMCVQTGVTSSSTPTTTATAKPTPDALSNPDDTLSSSILEWTSTTESAKPKFCQMTFYRGIQWPLTPVSFPKLMQCPNNPKKNAYWTCGDDGEWKGYPEMSLCTSDWVEDVERGANTASNVEDTVELTKKVKQNVISREEIYGGDAVIITETFDKLSERIEDQLLTVSSEKRFYAVREMTKAIVDTTNNLLQERRRETWEDLHYDTQIKCADQLMNSIERNSLLLAKMSTETEIISAPPNVAVEVGVIQIQDYVQFPSQSLYNPKMDSIQIPRAALETTSTINSNRAKVVFSSYKNLGQYMKPYRSSDSDVERKVVSKILSATMVGGPPVTRLTQPVVITLATSKNENLSNPVCVFWYSDSQSSSHYWSSDGCSVQMHNDTHTICACKHLTSFAVLMDVRGVYISSEHYLAMSLITYVGCIISIVALTLSIAAFCIFRGVQGDRATIHKNLCFCLLVAEIVFLFGIAQVEPKLACTVVAAVLHYFFLAAFAWMLLEGFQLYALLVEVFEAEQSRKKYFYAFAYGMPLLIVGISLGVDHTSYGTRRHCWLNTDNYFVFSFVGPVIVVLLANLIFLTMALIVMCRHRGSWSASHKHSPTKSSVENFGAWLKAAVVLVFLLGLTWSFGLFYVSQETQIIAYIFTVLNSLQGVFIFLFHVVLNEKMRREFRKWLRRNDWLPAWVREPVLAYDPTVYGVSPCGVPINSNSSSNGGVRSGATSPINTDTTNSGNISYLQRLFRPLATVKRDSNRPLLGRSSSSNSGSSGKHIYEYGYGRQQQQQRESTNSNVSNLSPRYIDGMRQIPNFPPPLPPPYSFDDPDLSTFDCSVVDSQYVNDFGDVDNNLDCVQQISPFLRSEPDSGYSGGGGDSESCPVSIVGEKSQNNNKNNNFFLNRRRSSFDDFSKRRQQQTKQTNDKETMVAYSPPETICCKSAPSLQKPDGCSHLMTSSECEKQTQTDDLELFVAAASWRSPTTSQPPLASLPDLNYEIPSSCSSSMVACGRNGRTNTFLLTTNDSKKLPPQRVRSCNK